MPRSLDSIAAAFREAWASGAPPNISEFLQQVDDADRDDLLKRLLPIDVDQRIGAGESVVAKNYASLGSTAVELAEENLRQFDSLTGLRATTSLSPTPVKSKQIGPYKLLQQIGEGGMGTVWMAEQEKPVRRRVALKLVKGEFGSKDSIARFEAERQALAMMDHQNIAKVLDAGTTESGSPYFVMELVKGIPITEYCDNNQLSIPERLELLIPVCKAVQHAHQKGIIHRDLKPSNVLVTLYDGKPVPKVIDFGLAKALESQTKLTDKTMFTQLGQVVGTVQYMSPEQAETNALDVDTRTDIYSLGVMLYELLTGSTPLDKETLGRNALLQVLAIIRETEPPRPSARLSSSGEAVTGISKQRKIAPAKLQQILRGELDWVVMKALEKDRTRRYDTASSLADDMQNYLDGDAVEARPPSVGYRLQKTFLKHRVAFATGSALVGLLIAGLLSTGTMWLQASSLADSNATLAREKTKLAKQAERQTSEARSAGEKERIARGNMEATLARSNYFVAVARWDVNRVAEATDFLDRVPAKYRQFEWRLAKRQFRGSDVTCYGHTDHVSSVSFSPDGARVASAGYDGTVKLWDASTGEELQTLKGHAGEVASVSFSPDGMRIVSAGDDNTVRLWDASTGETLQTLGGHTDKVTSVCFSPDGVRVASASFDRTVKLWDEATCEEPQTLTGHSGPVTSVCFSPNGARIASASVDRTIKLWDASTGEQLDTLQGHEEPVASVSFSPNGARIASASSDNTIRLWDASTGEELWVVRKHKADITSVCFSPDGAWIV